MSRAARRMPFCLDCRHALELRRLPVEEGMEEWKAIRITIAKAKAWAERDLR